MNRFIEAQHNDWKTALAEMKFGRKQSCWIWFILPQMLPDQRRSGTSKFYQLYDADNVKEYICHPILGSRLVEMLSIVNGHLNKGVNPVQLMGKTVRINVYTS